MSYLPQTSTKRSMLSLSPNKAIVLALISIATLASCTWAQQHIQLPVSFGGDPRSAATNKESLGAMSELLSSIVMSQIYGQPDAYYETLVMGALLKEKAPDNVKIKLKEFTLRGYTGENPTEGWIAKQVPQSFIVRQYDAEAGRFEIDVDIHLDHLNVALQAWKFGTWRVRDLRVGAGITFNIGDDMKMMNVVLSELDPDRVKFDLTMVANHHGFGGFFVRIWESFVRAIVFRVVRSAIQGLEGKKIDLGKHKPDPLHDAIGNFYKYAPEVKLLEKQPKHHLHIVELVEQRIERSIAEVRAQIEQEVPIIEKRLHDLNVDQASIDKNEQIRCNETTTIAGLMVSPGQANYTFEQDERRVMRHPAMQPDALERPHGDVQLTKPLQKMVDAKDFQALQICLSGWDALIKKIVFAAALNPKAQEKIMWDAALAIDSAVHTHGIKVRFQGMSLGIDSFNDIPDIVMAPEQPRQPFTYAIDLDLYLPRFYVKIEIHVLGIPVHVTVHGIRVRGELMVRLLPAYLTQRDFLTIWFEKMPNFNFEFKFTSSDKIANTVHKHINEAIRKAIHKKAMAPRKINIPFYPKAAKTVTALQKATNKIRTDVQTSDPFFSEALRRVRLIDQQFLCVLTELRVKVEKAAQRLARIESDALQTLPMLSISILTTVVALFSIV